MARYRIKNNTSNRLSVPAPVNQFLVGGADVFVNVPAAEMDGSAALHAMAHRGLISVLPLNDEAANDGLEVAAIAASGGARRVVWRDEFLDPAATVTLYCDPVNGNDSTATGSLNAPFQTIQASINSVPDGFVSIVDIQLLPGEVADDTGIAFTPRPGRGHSWATPTSGPWIRVYGAKTAVATITPPTGTTTAVVSAGGVTKSAQSTVECNAWGVPIVLGTHFLVQTLLGVEYTLPCLPAYSDENAGTLGVVSRAGNGWLGTDPMPLYELASTTKSSFYIVGNPQYRCEVHLMRFTFLVSVSSALLSGCDARGGLYATGNPLATGSIHRYDRLLFGVVVSSGTKNVISNCYGSGIESCYFNNGNGLAITSGHVGLLADSVFFYNSGYNLHLGSQLNGSSYHAGSVSIEEFEFIDFEGSGLSMAVNGGIVQQQGDITFEGGSTPMLLQHGAHWVRTAGLLKGKGTGAVLVQSGSQFVGAGVAHTYENTSTAGDQIKVGANAATTFALIGTGKNDFAAGDTSQGCRAA